MLNLSTHQPKPRNFKIHSYRKEYIIDKPKEKIWEWLNDPKTFTENQVWPYRVEFTPSPEQTNEFEEGVLNSHHGPLMSFTGVLGEIKEDYRDLKYLYGSYFLSFRWIRPQRLQFWTTDGNAEGTVVTMQLDSFVHPSFYGFWNFGLKLFWARFGKWLQKSIKKK